jgi:hypothetical protein
MARFHDDASGCTFTLRTSCRLHVDARPISYWYMRSLGRVWGSHGDLPPSLAYSAPNVCIAPS